MRSLEGTEGTEGTEKIHNEGTKLTETNGGMLPAIHPISFGNERMDGREH